MNLENNNDMKAPIFVLGTQRAGTTLLTRALSAHPNMFIQNEIGVERVFYDDAPKEVLQSRLIDRLSEIIKKPFCTYLQDNEIEFWGIKDPEFTEHLDSLSKFLPESKFILIVRDPRAVVNSYIDNKWGLGTTPYTGAERWVSEVGRQMDFLNAHPDDCLLIHYEALITDTEAQLRRACEHIGLAFHDDMLNYNKRSADFEMNRQNINTNKAPDKKHLDKWRKTFSPKDIENVEYVAQKEMSRQGYTLETKARAPSALSKWYYKLHQKIVGEIQIQYQWRRAMRKERQEAKK